MKLHRKRDLGKSGIYCIKNLINNKVYIGKSINIYERIRQHINLLNKESLDENRYLTNSWNKYGRDNFQYIVLEYLEKNESLLKERELYWMNYYDSTNRDKGYNLRQDTSTNCIVSEDTRKLQSKNRIQRYKDKPELRDKISKQFKEFWKNNPDKLKEMSKKVSKIITKYKIYQYDKYTKELVRVWDTLSDITKENPSYKKHNIYAVCSGEKPTMYGYIWEKRLINEDIVQSSEKSEITED
jgi:group I intron endonuclease